MQYSLFREVNDGLLETYSEQVYETYDEAQTAAQKAWADGDEVLIGELKLDATWEKPMCAAQTYAQTLETPAEYCENETELGSEYCSGHCDERP